MKPLLNFGVKSSYQTWEIFFARKVNMITLIGSSNVLLAFIVFPLIGITNLQHEFLCMLFVAPTVFLANKFFNYIVAAYCFFIPGAVFMFFLTVKMGIDSYIILFYFPIIMAVVQLSGRRETFKHLIVFLVAFVICVTAFAYHFYINGIESKIAPDVFKTLRTINIILGLATSIAFFAVITNENINQEEVIRKMLREKEVLLAEVYHRVKNNMTIVISLLNLKKNTSQSEEVKEALEACRSRVYSMALVHQKFFSQNNLTGIDFKVYISDLVAAVTNTFIDRSEIKVDIESDELCLDVTQAIPCGLILNELLTNSFKHAQPQNDILRINISIKNNGEQTHIQITDNGIGFDPSKSMRPESMGIELINSLCEQLDAKYGFEKSNGSNFSFLFKPKKSRVI